MAMDIRTDSSNQPYVEIDLASGQRIRVTHVPDGWPGGEVVRVQIRVENGHLHQGPDIPLENLGEVIQAMVELIRR